MRLLAEDGEHRSGELVQMYKDVKERQDQLKTHGTDLPPPSLLSPRLAPVPYRVLRSVGVSKAFELPCAPDILRGTHSLRETTLRLVSSCSL